MTISRRVERLGSGIFHRNDVRKESYRNKSITNSLSPLLDLSLGSTDLLPPAIVLEAIKKSIYEPESSSYCLHAATKPFREVVADWAEKRFGVDVDPNSEVLLLVGSQEGTAHLPLAVMNPGEAGLILDPSYPSHRGGLVLADAQIERLLLTANEGWKPDFGSLSNSQLDQLKIIVFGFPHNPTAQVGEQSWLDDAMACGVNHHIVIAHDNPYLDLSLEGDSPSLLRCEGWKEWGIEFYSLSKAWCLGGFRIAFAIGAKKLISGLVRLKSVVDFNQSLALQKGAIVALTSCLDCPGKVVEIYRERRDRTLRALSHLGWHVPSPSMAMYLWLPLPTWAVDKGWDDEHLAADLLEKTGIAITPGSGFGAGGANWLRLALVRPADEVEKAISRIGPWWNANS
ncbi:aminotransferase class I/II-fold pyridoxal phosphate-dependent enzyme [Prochlorococcus sp. MIT 1307]|uniref:aminotransferase class I/II-fold pyridoxal phosphate-dependent enzyme n=1 Tax=Prochlorococcus sp. MIT 1307 TaxID=3096219 RepID=UPI002A75618F|nr:aminotransferase class I/II-fold pyridoxal phosphate-dependent enzyme [Prochlorococcus sp. MIT 1307]